MLRVSLSIAGCLSLIVVMAGCRRGGEPDDAAIPVDSGLCVPSCPADACGDDGCGGRCRECASAEICVANACVSRDVVRQTVESFDTDASGEVSVIVPIAEDRSFMVVATANTDAYLAVLSVDNPAGARVLRWQDWYDASQGLTNAFFATDPVTVLNWPVRAEDPALVSGEYVVRIGTFEADGETPLANIPIEVTTITTRDDDVESGLVRVVLLYAAGLDEDEHLVSSTELAVAHWQEIWAPFGIEVSVRSTSSTIDPALPYPEGPGGATLLAASNAAAPGEVVVLLGETIEESPGTYGIAGQLPGPIVPTTMSAVVVSWLTCAGADGVFSDSDVTLYGEVLAHEVGHYLGLFHPVSDSFDDWDAIEDTEECGGLSRCESVLGTNLMYPYSICDGDSCVSTTELTPGQQGVLHHYVGTL